MIKAYVAKVKEEEYYAFSLIPNKVVFGETSEQAWENLKTYLKEYCNLTVIDIEPNLIN